MKKYLFCKVLPYFQKLVLLRNDTWSEKSQENVMLLDKPSKEEFDRLSNKRICELLDLIRNGKNFINNYKAARELLKEMGEHKNFNYLLSVLGEDFNNRFHKEINQVISYHIATIRGGINVEYNYKEAQTLLSFMDDKYPNKIYLTWALETDYRNIKAKNNRSGK